MTPSDFTADLPAPRDDEPQSLRADIVDELADHLQCAIRREELQSHSEPWGSAPRNEPNDGGAEPRRSPACQRALARFGNPAAIARKLWWDAMWEKIMLQRILTGLTALAVVACCVMAFLMWRMLTQMQSAQRDLLAESQAQNARLLEQFQSLVGELRADSVSAAPAEWVPLTVKCTFDTEDGAPAEGVKVRLRGDTERTVGIGGEQTTDADGIVDFGKVLYARYDVMCTLQSGLTLRDRISVRPGKAQEVKIACPSAPPPLAEVKIDIRPPENLRLTPLRYLLLIDTGYQAVQGKRWRVDSEEFSVPCYVLGGDGTLLGQLSSECSQNLREQWRPFGSMNNGPGTDWLLDRLNNSGISPATNHPDYVLSGSVIVLATNKSDGSEGTNGAVLGVTDVVSQNRHEFLTNDDGQIVLVNADSFWSELELRVRRSALRSPM